MSGSRSISSALLAHLQGEATTLAMLIKVTPRYPEYAAFGICNSDRDIVYDDGTGSLTYSASIGMVPAELQSQASMEVGTSEFQHLVQPQFSINVSEELIRAGVYDYAAYTVYVVNYADLTMGHWIPPAGFGQVGQLAIDDRGLSFRMELTDLSKLTKQAIVENYSITCRAIFGSQPIGTGGGVVEERYPCGFDASTLWQGPYTVTSVSTAEPTLTFAASALGAPATTFQPGMVKWDTGDNAGRQEAVDSQDGSGVISLNNELPFPVVVGDTFHIRKDCTKWKDGTNGCKDHFSAVGPNEWKLHYRGEPFINPGDADANATPFATLGTGDA